jgi:hypothetical protein
MVRGGSYAAWVNTLLHGLAAYGPGFTFLRMRPLPVGLGACAAAGLPVERPTGG